MSNIRGSARAPGIRTSSVRVRRDTPLVNESVADVQRQMAASSSARGGHSRHDGFQASNRHDTQFFGDGLLPTPLMNIPVNAPANYHCMPAAVPPLLDSGPSQDDAGCYPYHQQPTPGWQMYRHFDSAFMQPPPPGVHHQQSSAVSGRGRAGSGGQRRPAARACQPAAQSGRGRPLTPTAVSSVPNVVPVLPQNTAHSSSVITAHSSSVSNRGRGSDRGRGRGGRYTRPNTDSTESPGGSMLQSSMKAQCVSSVQNTTGRCGRQSNRRSRGGRPWQTRGWKQPPASELSIPEVDNVSVADTDDGQSDLMSNAYTTDSSDVTDLDDDDDDVAMHDNAVLPTVTYHRGRHFSYRGGGRARRGVRGGRGRGATAKQLNDSTDLISFSPPSSSVLLQMDYEASNVDTSEWVSDSESAISDVRTDTDVKSQASRGRGRKAQRGRQHNQRQKGTARQPAVETDGNVQHSEGVENLLEAAVIDGTESQYSALFWKLVDEHNGTCSVDQLQKLLGIQDADTAIAALRKLKGIKVLLNEADRSKSVAFVFVKFLRLCMHVRAGCTNGKCCFLHICPDLITECCLLGAECRFIHDVRAPINENCLSKCDIPESISSVSVLTIARCSNLIVCAAHNEIENLQCINPQQCIRLHVCNDYVCGTCEAPDLCCRFGHDLNKQNIVARLAAFEVKHLLHPTKLRSLCQMILAVNKEHAILLGKQSAAQLACHPVASGEVLRSPASQPKQSIAKSPKKKQKNKQGTPAVKHLPANSQFKVDENSLFWMLVHEHVGICVLDELRTHLNASTVDSVLAAIRNFKRIKVLLNEVDRSKSVAFVFLKGLRLCMRGRAGCKDNDCQYLHICREFLARTCVKGEDACRFGHDVRADCNEKCLTKCGIPESCSSEAVLTIARCSNLIVCAAYNEIGGSQCINPEQCIRLHVCNKFFCGKCLLEAKDCDLGHNLAEKDAAVLSAYEVTHLLEPDKLKMLHRMIVTVSKPAPSSRQSAQLLRASVTRPTVHQDLLTDTQQSDNRQAAVNNATIRPHGEGKTLKQPISLPKFTIKGNQAVQAAGKKPVQPKTAEQTYGSAVLQLQPSDASTTLSENESATEAHLESVTRLVGRRDGTVSNEYSCCERYEKHCCNNATSDCTARHNQLPYHWRVKVGGHWKPFDDKENVAIEEAYCFPYNTSFTVVFQACAYDVDFTTMYFSLGEVERLTTPSYVVCRNKCDATRWCWYWNAGDANSKDWILYEDTKQPYRDVLEAKYLADPRQTCCFESDEFQYELNFSTMKQRNMRTGREREVCRRPYFVSVGDLLSGGLPLAVFNYDPEKLPLNERWLPMDTETTSWTDLVPVNPQHTDMKHVYSHVTAEFRRTLSAQDFDISRVYRVQNLELWRKYQSKKLRMEKEEHLVSVGAGERKLFHGTPDEKTVRCICYQNFDPRMHGRHATAFGKGAYFSTTAKYSHSYTQPCAENKAKRFMFLARVLVGQSTLGRTEYQRPPPVDAGRPHGALYDSCVNSVSDPSIFVIFDNDQCYPEFLIEYKERPTARAVASTPVAPPRSTTSGSATSSYPRAGSSTAVPASLARLSHSSSQPAVIPAAAPAAHQPPAAVPRTVPRTISYTVNASSSQSPSVSHSSSLYHAQAAASLASPASSARGSAAAATANTQTTAPPQKKGCTVM